MSSLRSLYLRWCCQVLALHASRDWGVVWGGGGRWESSHPDGPLTWSGPTQILVRKSGIPPHSAADISGVRGVPKALTSIPHLPPGSVGELRQLCFEPHSLPLQQLQACGLTPGVGLLQGAREIVNSPRPPAQVQDFGLKHLLAMRSLRLLSLAGETPLARPGR